MLTSLFFLLLLSATEGDLRLRYEPRYCVKAPCPQFKVLAINGKGQTIGEGDLINHDPQSLRLHPGQNLQVKGRWTDEEGYLKIIAESVIPLPTPTKMP